MYEYLEKNCAMSNWFDKVYFTNKLKNLKSAIKFMKQTTFEFNKESLVWELRKSSENFSFEFNREKEIIREVSGDGLFEIKYKNFKEKKILSKHYFPDNSTEFFEYDQQTGLANKYIKINDGVRTEQALKIDILEDGSIIHSNVSMEVHYDSDGHTLLERDRNSDLELIYDYSGYGKKGFYTKTQRIGDQIHVVEKYGNKNEFLIGRISYRNNIVSSKDMLFFDETDKLVQYLKIFDEDSFDNHYYFYNDKDLLIEDRISLPNGYMGTDHLFEYDQYDNLIKTTDRSYEYKYDQKGNWIERTEIYRGEISNKTTREFTYLPAGLHLV
ncbi:hypothetical protein Q1W71_04130 [Flavobacterium pectinovorum]|uniref:hypothetical protein n=1 Tax=Flavobacterium pectinovorum TaxID=29533 RepID=UPI00265D88B5|nr:hypothetical protein [Flavobacterium pectinovorum]WKL48975.1 hypothetical protein Q1W71_04130 [Flavobacterium pectinovorum]